MAEAGDVRGRGWQRQGMVEAGDGGGRGWWRQGMVEVGDGGSKEMVEVKKWCR